MLKARCLSSSSASIKRCGLGKMRNSLVDVTADDQAALLIWEGSEEKAPSALCLTADSTLSVWSIPLSLNFVRRSFSLPSSVDGSERNLPCLLSTHNSDHTTYIVISEDLAPRLLITNLCLKPFEVTEAGAIDAHRHPQLIGTGQKVDYEPPSLAKQYPLINLQEEEGEERGSAFFKTVDKVMLKLRMAANDGVLQEEEEKEWSRSFHLLPDSEQAVRVPHYETIFVTISSEGGTTHVSLMPMSGQVAEAPAADKVNTHDSKTPDSCLRVSCHVEQLVVSIDCELAEEAVIQPVARVVSDTIELSYSRNLEDIRGSVTVSSIQVDNIMSVDEGGTSGYKVVLLPRREHSPPHQLVKTESPPLLSIAFRKALPPSTLIHSIHVSAQPITLQLDTRFLQKVKTVLSSYRPPEGTQLKESHEEKVPASVLAEVVRDEMPVVISSLVVEPLTAYVSARVTVKVAISCDDTILRLPHFELVHVYSNWMEVSNCLAAHYTTQLLWQVWWGLGSVDLIGSPTVLLHSIRSGVHDFFSLPYEGLTMGPGFFIVGLGQGVAALAGSLSSGMLRSITNFTSGVAYNMERLSLDPEHASYQEEYRRRCGEAPTHLTSGLVSGASSFGMSVMSALAGVVDQPMRSVQATSDMDVGVGGYTKSILKGVGKGLLGVVTKPVGGALQLVSQTGQGLMSSIGLLSTPQHKTTSSDGFCAPVSRGMLTPTTTRYVD